jgi:hypothetical protein
LAEWSDYGEGREQLQSLIFRLGIGLPSGGQPRYNR